LGAPQRRAFTSNQPALKPEQLEKEAMKTYTRACLLALSVALACQEEAPAWCRFNFGVGANIGMQSGGSKSILWGFYQSSDVPPGGLPPAGLGGPLPGQGEGPGPGQFGEQTGGGPAGAGLGWFDIPPGGRSWSPGMGEYRGLEMEQRFQDYSQGWMNPTF
jgi:hypothetical protein